MTSNSGSDKISMMNDRGNLISVAIVCVVALIASVIFACSHQHHKPKPEGELFSTQGYSLEGLNAAVPSTTTTTLPPPPPPPPPPKRYSANWDAIAHCETGSNWQMVGSTYSGGLGFANTTWDAFGGRQFAAKAGWASREQQMDIAENVYRRYGLTGWGCRRFG